MRNTRMAIVGLLAMLLVSYPRAQEDAQSTKGGPNLVVLTSVTPSSIPVGSGDTVVVMIGTGFKNPMNAQWNNSVLLPAQLQSSNRMTTTIPAAQLVTAGSGTIRALQGGQGNQSASNSLTITITSATPTLTSVTPLHGVVGAPPVTLTMTGTNFNSSSVAKWTAGTSTTSLATTFVSGTSLTAVVPTSLLVSPPSTATVLVANGTSNSTTQTFTIVPVLSITTTSLPGGTIGVAYTTTLAATGGVTPYSWSVTSGTLPPGLTLAAGTGVISGTPTAAGSSTFTIQCTDATGGLARRTMGKKKKTE